jgi:polyisoprenoid-binding protein YceI
MSTQIWQLDNVHSVIQFTVRHLVVASVRGRFQRWSAELAIDETELTRSSVSVTIEAASIDTGDAQRDGHLRSPDFLDADNHPALTFRSRRIERWGKDHYRVVGDLTIRDVTKEVTLEAELGGYVRDPWGGRRVGFSATASILRSAYGLVWNQALETGGVAVGDRVDMSFDLEAVAPASEQQVA